MTNKKQQKKVEANEDSSFSSSLKKQLVSVVKFKTRRVKNKEENQKAGIATAVSMFGLIGWSISVPVILSILIGNFVVKKFDGDTSWLINFIVFGFAIGIYNSYKEIKKTFIKDFNDDLKNKKKSNTND